MKTVIDILEQNKIQIQSTNGHLKRFFSIQLEVIQPPQSTTQIDISIRVKHMILCKANV